MGVHDFPAGRTVQGSDEAGVFSDPARDGREVPFKFYAPSEHNLSSYPLVVWSHGSGGNADGAGFISRYLASYGYAVAHLTHRGTDSSLWEGKPGHPWIFCGRCGCGGRRRSTGCRTCRFPGPFAGMGRGAAGDFPVYRFSRIGMSGHSFGAMTTQAMAGMPLPDREESCWISAIRVFGPGFSIALCRLRIFRICRPPSFTGR